MTKVIIKLNQKWYLQEQKEEKLKLTPLTEIEDIAFEIKSTKKARSVKQNASLHLYCAKVAKALNNGGFTVQKFLRRKQEKKIELIFNNLSLRLGLSVSQDDLKLIQDAKEDILGSQDLELEWTMQTVKDIIWRNIQLAIFKDKTSTTELSSEEVTQVYKAVDRYLVGIGVESVDFPSEESLIYEQNYKGN